jgi:agmatinase
VIDPAARWRRLGVSKAAWAGLLTFADVPYTEDPSELAGVDVAVVGAPMDDLVSDAPGTRFGPRAVRAAPPTDSYHLEAKVDWAEILKVVDYGDAPVVPTDSERSHRVIEELVTEVLVTGAMPIVLGGDHSVSEPDVRACARHFGRPVGLVHFDTHTDTAAELYGQSLSHGTPFYNLVAQGHVDPKRYVQVGLRGWWPGRVEFAWQERHGITSLYMHDVRDLGIREVVRRAIEIVGAGPVFLTVDVDVLDPAYAPGTGTPEPGGMTPLDLNWACRAIAGELELVGADVVEVIPAGHGAADLAALAANRVVREILTGLAMRRKGRSAPTESTASTGV